MKPAVTQLILSVLAAAAFSRPAAAELRSVFAYRLSDTTGALPLSWTPLAWDATAGELYVIDSGTGLVDVFNENGMNVFVFGDDTALATLAGVAPLADGDLAALVRRGERWTLLRCNFRGEPKAEIVLQGVPASFGDFSPGALRTANGKLYLADKGAMKVLVVSPGGAFLGSWDLKALLHFNKKTGANADLRGFNVDSAGNLLGTIPGLFLAFRVTPEGQLQSFGTRGSSAGKFNIVAGIASDESGHLYVADTLKCAVLVFDKDLKFIDQFGYRGQDDDEGLIAPSELEVGGGFVFVSQSVGGVKAFQVLLD